MVTDSNPPDDLTLSHIETLRGHLGSLLAEWTKEVAAAGQALAVDTVCNGLESLPVPILGKALANAVRKRFGGSRDPEATKTVLDLLQRMEKSNLAFDSGMQSLGISLNALSRDLAEVKAHLIQRDAPNLQVLSPAVYTSWPMADNRIEMLLANTGGGSVVADELHLEVEDWEPETKADFTVPAAPLNIVYLKARLTVHRSDYPLLKLNGLGPRVFNERGAGAEKFIMDLNSPNNAIFHLRVRVSYLDLSSGQQRSLYHPSPGEPPILLSFPCAPGWREVDTRDLLEKEGVFENMLSTFRGIASLTEEASARPNRIYDLLDYWSQELGIMEYVLQVPITFHHLLQRTIPLFCELATQLGRQRVAFEVLVRILKEMYNLHPEEKRYTDGIADVVDPMTELAGNSTLNILIERLLEPSLDPSFRSDLASRIMEGAKV